MGPSGPRFPCGLQMLGGMPSRSASRRLRVLVACEFSAIVREAFNRLGHDATSCDLLATEIPGKHWRADAREVLTYREWDLVIAHPTCTYLCNSGVRWLYGKRGGSTVIDAGRWAAMLEGAAFFRSFFDGYAGRLCVENPVMHSHGLAAVGDVGPGVIKQMVQPYQFGHLETKATVLWLRGLPRLVATDDVEAAMRRLPKSQTNRVHLASPGPDRWAQRSRTFPGIAEAMAMQWGGRVPVTVSLSVSTTTTKETK